MEVFGIPDVCTGIFDFADEYRTHSMYLTKGAGVVINSFEHYEQVEVAALRACLEKAAGNGKIPKVSLIGPVQCLPIKPLGHSKKELTAETDSSGCLRFVDTQQKASVLFICFGSQVSLDRPSITELARGLEDSEVPFLWIVPCPAQATNLPSWNVSYMLPTGFLERTKGRFVSIEWAPLGLYGPTSS